MIILVKLVDKASHQGLSLLSFSLSLSLSLICEVQVSLTLGCPMDLALFPLDTQTCHLTIASYGWAANDLVYLWKVREE